MRTHEANQQQRELRKLKMTYEILARNELNAKLAEINTFLEDRAAAQADNERRKEKIMDEIQKDLGDRLQKSRDELTEIKKNMMGKTSAIVNVFLEYLTLCWQLKGSYYLGSGYGSFGKAATSNARDHWQFLNTT